MVFPSHRYRGTPCRQFAGVWRSHLPPQSFLPVGIGEITPATNSASFTFVSLHSLSYLWVSGRRPCCYLGWRRLRRLMPASSFMSFQVTPRASHASVASGVVPNLALTLTFGLVDAWAAMSSRPFPYLPQGAPCIAEGTSSHSTCFTWRFLYG